MRLSFELEVVEPGLPRLAPLPEAPKQAGSLIDRAITHAEEIRSVICADALVTDVLHTRRIGTLTPVRATGGGVSEEQLAEA